MQLLHVLSIFFALSGAGLALVAAVGGRVASGFITSSIVDRLYILGYLCMGLSIVFFILQGLPA